MPDVNLGTMRTRIDGDGTPYERFLSNAVSMSRQGASAIASALGTVAGAALSAGKAIAVVGSISLAGITASFVAGVKNLEAADVQARSLGVSVTELRTAMIVAGPAADKMVATIASLQERLYGLKSGFKSSHDDFAAFLSLTGTAESRLKGGFTDSLEAVVEGLTKIEDPVVRSAQAFRLLGETAYPILAQLDAGVGGVGSAQSLIKRAGLGIDPGEMAAVRQAGETIRQIQSLISGVFNQGLLAVTPFVNQLSKVFDPKTLDLSWVKGAVQDVVKGVVMMTAFFVAATKDTSLFWDAFEVGIKKVEAALLRALASMAKLIDKATGAGGQKKVFFIDDWIFGRPNDKQADEEDKKFIKATGGDPTHKGFLGGGKALDDAAKEAQEKADDLQKKLNDKFGKTDAAKAGKKFIKEALDAVDEMNKKLSEGPQAEATAKKYTDMFNTIKEGAKGAIGAWTEGLENLDQITRAGHFAGNQGLAEFQAGTLFNNLRSGAGLNAAPQLAGAAEAQTREAYSSAVQYAQLGSRGDVQEQMRQALEVANMQREAIKDIGRQILDANKKVAEAAKTEDWNGDAAGGW